VDIAEGDETGADIVVENDLLRKERGANNDNDKINPKSDVDVVGAESIIDPDETDIKVRSRAWTIEEDELVQLLVSQVGPKKWALIAGQLQGKTQKQAYARWRDYLQPGLTARPWTKWEEIHLLDCHTVAAPIKPPNCESRHTAVGDMGSNQTAVEDAGSNQNALEDAGSNQTASGKLHDRVALKIKESLPYVCGCLIVMIGFVVILPWNQTGFGDAGSSQTASGEIHDRVALTITESLPHVFGCLIVMIALVVILPSVHKMILAVLTNIVEMLACSMLVLIVSWLLSTCHAMKLSWPEQFWLMAFCYTTDWLCCYRMTKGSPFALFCGCMLVVSMCLVANGRDFMGNPMCSLGFSLQACASWRTPDFWNRVFMNVLMWVGIYIACRKHFFVHLCTVLGVVYLTLTVCTITMHTLVHGFILLADKNAMAKYLLWCIMFLCVIHLVRLFKHKVL
jgi:hypothetical protein